MSVSHLSWPIVERNSVTVIGDAERCILFAHGMGTDQRMWSQIEKTFPENRRLLLDHVGFGKSDISQYSAQRYSSLSAYVTDLLEIVRALDIRHITAVGHSVGGMIVLAAAAEEPDLFDGVVTMGSSACYLNIGDYRGGFEHEQLDQIVSMIDVNRVAWAREIVTYAAANTISSMVVDELVNSFASVPAAVMRNFLRIVFALDMRSLLPHITTRTLVIQGVRDPFVPGAAAEFLSSTLPNATYRRLAYEGHFPTITHPELIVRAIREFLPPL